MNPLYRGNTKCDCKDQCKEFVDPLEDCINRLDGDIATAHCEKCNPMNVEAHTWHQDGKCIKCTIQKS